MKKLFYMGMGLLLCLSAAVFAGCEKNPVEEQPEYGTIYGVVSDLDTAEPLSDVTVTLSPGGATLKTDADGYFEFAELEIRQYTITVQKDGYSTNRKTFDAVANERVEANIQMVGRESWRIVNDKKEDIDELDFGAEDETVTRSFNLLNDGKRALQWQITTEAAWITEVSMENGTLQPGATQSISITIDRAKLSYGDNVTTVNIQLNAESCQLKIKAKRRFTAPEGSYITIPELRLMVLENDMPLGEYAWEDAKAACEQLTAGGYTDWRLPTISELAALCERKSEIGGLMQDVYWTGSKREGYDSGFHQLVNFEDDEYCYQGWARDDYSYRVRAVRTITE